MMEAAVILAIGILSIALVFTTRSPRAERVLVRAKGSRQQ